MQTNYLKLLDRIDSACSKRKFAKKPVELLAVSKKHDVDKILELHRYGQRYFGENYAQELKEKSIELSGKEIRWSFIGQLQSNKIKSIVQYSSEIQTVARLKDAQLISRYANELNKTPFPVFICVNIGLESNKGGAKLEDLASLTASITQTLPNLELQGIMAIPPPLKDLKLDETSQLPWSYLELQSCAPKIGRGRLSLGMSADLEAAIAVGSDIVRVGTALFGPRKEDVRGLNCEPLTIITKSRCED